MYLCSMHIIFLLFTNEYKLDKTKHYKVYNCIFGLHRYSTFVCCQQQCTSRQVNGFNGEHRSRNLPIWTGILLSTMHGLGSWRAQRTITTCCWQCLLALNLLEGTPSSALPLHCKYLRNYSTLPFSNVFTYCYCGITKYFNCILYWRLLITTCWKLR